MKTIVKLTVLSCVGFLLMGFLCSYASKEIRIEPAEVNYNVHYGDIDTDNDGVIDWEEFTTNFPDGTREVFDNADTDGNGVIEHREWHILKQVSGYKLGEHHK